MPGKSHNKGASSAAANADDAADASSSSNPLDEGKHNTTLPINTALKLSKIKDLAAQLPILTNGNYYSWDVALKI